MRSRPSQRKRYFDALMENATVQLLPHVDDESAAKVSTWEGTDGEGADNVDPNDTIGIYIVRALPVRVNTFPRGNLWSTPSR